MPDLPYGKPGPAIAHTLLVSSNFVGIQVELIATHFFHVTLNIEKFPFTLSYNY